MGINAANAAAAAATAGAHGSSVLQKVLCLDPPYEDTLGF